MKRKIELEISEEQYRNLSTVVLHLSKVNGNIWTRADEIKCFLDMTGFWKGIKEQAEEVREGGRLV